MHELPIVKQILEAVLAHAEENHAARVCKVVLDIGGMHDLVPEWVEKFFNFASRGTIAEHARLVINQTPIICRCNACGCNFVFRLHTEQHPLCPDCNAESFSLIAGKELLLREIEVC